MNLDPSMIFNVLLLCGYLLVMIRIIGKVFQGRFGKPRTVSAEVIGKQTVEQFSKYAGNGKRVRYVVIFQAEGKKRSFYVSEFSYHGYRKGEKGKLTYQGDRLIDFS